MEPTFPQRAATDPFAAPGVAPRPGSDSSGAVLTLEVDGEVFELRADEYGGTGYLWLTGPNNGYGFGSSPTRGWSLEQHRENIRSFLAQVDPTTGYIGG